MRLSLMAVSGGLLGLGLSLHPAAAMQFEPLPVSQTEVIIGGRGAIVSGDTARLEQALSAVPRALTVLALALDSPGGSVTEGEQLARLIRARHLPVAIPASSKCVSACFLLLAASPRRLAATDALIGVHSASENGEETNTSLAVTTMMARDAARLGIPSAIVGKMVQTVAGRVEWLTRADLESMNVTVFDGEPAVAARHVTAATDASVTPAETSRPRTGYAAGRYDRLGWDTWLATLGGAYRDGAEFAQTQFALAQPGSCFDANGLPRGDFTPGCTTALQRLAPLAVRIRADPDYAAGWNGTAPVAASVLPVEMEYQGALFCGRQAVRLSLAVYPSSDQPRRRAMFSFGPQPTSPDVPRGAFIVEGSIEPRGGTISVAPVSWVSRPPGFAWLGLNGNSEDGGRTFSGRATDNAACSVFTLRQVSDATASK